MSVCWSSISSRTPCVSASPTTKEPPKATVYQNRAYKILELNNFAKLAHLGTFFWRCIGAVQHSRVSHRSFSWSERFSSASRRWRNSPIDNSLKLSLDCVHFSLQNINKNVRIIILAILGKFSTLKLEERKSSGHLNAKNFKRKVNRIEFLLETSKIWQDRFLEASIRIKWSQTRKIWGKKSKNSCIEQIKIPC